MVKSNKQREEKQNKRNKMLISGIMVIILVGSVLGIFLGNDSDPNKIEFKSENGKTYKFNVGNGILSTKIENTEINFYNHPLDVKKINFSSDALSLIQNAQVVGITFDPKSKDVQFFEQARFDLTKDFSLKQKYVVPGVTKNETPYQNFMVITCANSSVQAPVMEFLSTNLTETKVYVKNNNCIIFEGKKYDFLKFRDYIVYKMYGLI